MRKLILVKKLFATLILTLVLFFNFVTIDAAYGNTGNYYYNEAYQSTVIPDNYYSKVDLSLSGEAFKKSLYDIISVGHTRKSYDYVWEGIKYSEPVIGKADTVKCIYTGVDLYQASAASGVIVWNREHVWPKSHGFPTDEPSNYAFTDLHHLRASEKSINQYKSNSDFADLTGVSGVKSDSYGNRWTSDRFEPRDEVKGDIARMIFYMETRYHFDSYVGITIVEDDVTPNLKPYIGKLSVLLKWHEQDPVSADEIYRNNAVYDIQGNRNPYIDHPEYVDKAYSVNNLPYISDIESGTTGGDTGGDTGGTTTPPSTSINLNDATSVTYTVASKTSVTPDKQLTGVSYSFSNTYSGAKDQMTKGKSQTLMLTGFNNVLIESIVLSMHSNSSTGAGRYTIQIGENVVKQIDDSNFDSANWYGAYTSNYVNITLNLNNVKVNENEEIIITLAASTNSLYCNSYTINYAVDSSNAVKEEAKASISNSSIQSKFSFNYNEVSTTETITMSDVFSSATANVNIVGDTTLSDGLTLNVVKYNSSTSNYNFESKHIRIYKNDEFSIISANKNIEKVEFTCQSGYTDISNVSNCTVTASGTLVTVVNNASSNRVELKNINKTRIVSIKVYYKENVYSNTQLQFKFDFDFAKYKDVLDKSGMIITDDVNIYNNITDGLSDYELQSLLQTGNTKNVSINHTTFDKTSYVFGIDFSNLSDCAKEFYCIGYIQINGQYYFTQKLTSPKSILSMCSTYIDSTDLGLTDEIKTVLTDLKNQINKGGN